MSFHSVLNLHSLLSASVCLWDEVGNGGCISIYVYMCVCLCVRERGRCEKDEGGEMGLYLYVCLFLCLCVFCLSVPAFPVQGSYMVTF